MYRDNLPFATEKECSDFYVNKLREQVIYEGPDSVAAIVMETITGSNVVIIPPEATSQECARSAMTTAS